MEPEQVSQNEVKRAVIALKNTNPTEIDDFALQYPEDTLAVILSYIRTVINTSIAADIFLEIWKRAIVEAMHISWDQNEPSYFRLISLLPCPI